MTPLGVALQAYLAERGKSLDTSPLATLEIPLQGGDRLLVPILFLLPRDEPAPQPFTGV